MVSLAPGLLFGGAWSISLLHLKSELKVLNKTIATENGYVLDSQRSAIAIEWTSTHPKFIASFTEEPWHLA